MRRFAFVLAVTTIVAFFNVALAGSWPQFHGPNASGHADGNDKLPARIGPNDNLIWKVPLPNAHSSPVVFGDRVYVNGHRDKKLLTISIDARTGQIVWEREAPYKHLEQFNRSAGNLVQSTPATDGERVVSLFGSCGLFCYDIDGKPLWHIPMGPFKNDFGAGSSPIIVGDRVIVSQDHDTDSFLMAVDKRTGKPVWKTDRSEFPRGYATPVIWEVNGKKQIVVVGTLRAIGYDFETGKEVWTVRGLARIINMTPFVGPDNTLYVPAWAPGGDDTDRIDAIPFEEMIRLYDKNKNGTLEPDEPPEGPIKQRFTQIDLNKDGHITKNEYEFMRRIFTDAKNVIVAVKPGGAGDITETHVLWSQKKYLGYVPSPIIAKGNIFLVKNGGIVTSLDAKTGQAVKSERVPGGGNYSSSLVYGDGKIYVVSERGDISVISAEAQWKLLSRSRLEEDVHGTPAIADGRIYVRTHGNLYCFGQK